MSRVVVPLYTRWVRGSSICECHPANRATAARHGRRHHALRPFSALPRRRVLQRQGESSDELGPRVCWFLLTRFGAQPLGPANGVQRATSRPGRVERRGRPLSLCLSTRAGFGALQSVSVTLQTIRAPRAMGGATRRCGLSRVGRGIARHGCSEHPHRSLAARCSGSCSPDSGPNHWVLPTASCALFRALTSPEAVADPGRCAPRHTLGAGLFIL
jgi:hypothetical protein